MLDDFENKPPVFVVQKVAFNILSPRTFKSLAELMTWWTEGIESNKNAPLADWKTDNPLHPLYQKQDQNELEEA